MQHPSPLRPFLAIVLSYLLAAPILPAQAPAAVPKALNIVIVEGDGAINNIRQRVAREPIVEVTDENRKPVAGAIVTFLLPGSGPSGAFPGGANTLTVTTDSMGRAAARGLRGNALEGSYRVRVTASYQGLTASTEFGMSNAAAAAAAGMSAAKIWTIIAIAGAAAAGATFAATRGSDSPAPRPPVGVTPGTPTVGPPR